MVSIGLYCVCSIQTNTHRIHALFERNRDHDVAWKATRFCSRSAYEKTRKILGGYHLLDNAFWGKRFLDVQLQVCIDLYKYVLFCM